VLPVDTEFDLSWACNIRTAKLEKMHMFRGAILYTITASPSSARSADVKVTDEKWSTIPSVGGDDEDSTLVIIVALVGALVVIAVVVGIICKLSATKNRS